MEDERATRYSTHSIKRLRKLRFWIVAKILFVICILPCLCLSQNIPGGVTLEGFSTENESLMNPLQNQCFQSPTFSSAIAELDPALEETKDNSQLFGATIPNESIISPFDLSPLSQLTQSNRPIGDCYTKAIKQSSLDPGLYPKIKLASPAHERIEIAAAPDSIEFFVDMPESHILPYELGDGKDFSGKALICPMTDMWTGQRYDSITLLFDWGENSGGVYNISYSYTPLGGSPSQSVKVQNLYFIDAEDNSDRLDDCIGGSSQEYLPFENDLVLTPREYYQNNDPGMIKMRGLYSSYKLINSVPSMVNEITRTFEQKKKKLTVVLASHGNVDRWVGWWQYNELDKRIPSGLSGSEKHAVDFAKGINGKVETIYFESCCTAKRKFIGWRDNLLDTVSYHSTADGEQWTHVCGWTHLTYSIERRNSRFDSSSVTYHRAKTKGDSLVCSSRP